PFCTLPSSPYQLLPKPASSRNENSGSRGLARLDCTVRFGGFSEREAGADADRHLVLLDHLEESRRRGAHLLRSGAIIAECRAGDEDRSRLEQIERRERRHPPRCIAI